jgi:hypothetical protein
VTTVARKTMNIQILDPSQPAVLDPPVIGWLFARWRADRGPAGLPPAGWVPIDGPPRLSDMMARIAFDPVARRFRYLAVGRDLVAHRESLRVVDPTGLHMDEIDFHSDPTDMMSVLTLAAYSGKPICAEATYSARYGRQGSYRWLLLPLGGGTVSEVMTAIVYSDAASGETG